MKRTPITLDLSMYANRAVKAIQRKGETDEDTINRILEKVCAIRNSFDEHFGPPDDGLGPSGKPLKVNK